MIGIDMILYLLFTMSGLVLMKLGSPGTELSFHGGSLGLKVGVLMILGFACYLVSFVMYVGLVKKYPLVFLQPFTIGAVLILTLVVGFFFLKESVNAYGIVGAVLVLAGVILLNVKK